MWNDINNIKIGTLFYTVSSCFDLVISEKDGFCLCIIINWFQKNLCKLFVL